MNSILFIRHAETGLAGTFCGHTDPELNERGRQQSAALVRELEETPIDAVYASDLRRARATAQAIADRRGLTLHLRPAFREIDFGAWEGLTWAQIELLDPLFAQAWVGSFPALPAPCGEHFADFEHRVLTAVRELRMESSQQIAVVTHAGVLRVILERLCGVAPAQAWEQSRRFCSIVTYQATPGNVPATRIAKPSGRPMAHASKTNSQQP